MFCISLLLNFFENGLCQRGNFIPFKLSKMWWPTIKGTIFDFTICSYIHSSLYTINPFSCRNLTVAIAIRYS